MLRMRLSIVVPAHNEEHRIGPMLEAYLPYFTSRYGDKVEFLVVVNGSTDETEEVVAGFAARYSQVRAIVEPEPIGKGGALMVGFRHAQGEWVGFVDADGSTPPEAFHDLVENIGQAGGIIASRWAKGSQVSPRQPFDRRVASRIFNLMTRTLFGLRLTDTQCGAKLIRREAIQAILPHLGITRWAFDVDLLFQLRRAGYAIKEIPTIWHDVEGSKIQVGKASTEMMMALVRLRLIYSPFSWVVKLYGLVGPWIHPVGEARDYLITHSLVLFIGTQFGNICNMLFQIIMARMLSNAEYGVLFAALSALMMLSMPLSALNGAVTHFTALFSAKGKQEKIIAMMVGLFRDLLLPTVLLVLMVVLWRQDLMRAFKLDSPGPVYLVAGTIVLLLLGSVASGVLAGMQAFEWVALIGNGWTLLRLVLGIVLALLGLGAIGGLTANMVGVLISVALSLAVCISLLGRHWKGLKRPVGLYSYMGGYMMTVTAFGVLTSADVLLVKYYFTPEEAGAFSKATMWARMAFFLPSPVCSAMFPKVTSTGESSRANHRTLMKALVLTGLLGGGIGLVSLAVPELLLGILSKEIHPGQANILRCMALALAPLTLLMVLLNYELAQRRFRIMIPLYLCAGGYVLGVMRWHETLFQVVGVLGAMSVTALGLSLVVVKSSRAVRGALGEK